MPNRTNSVRYPELPDNITMEELVRRWSELVRALGDRDRQPIDPAEVYGRNIEVGGTDFDNVVFVTAGTSLPIAPTPAYWNIYQYQIPRDVGLVYVQPVPVSATANVQVQTFLPLAQSVEGRTITIAGGNTDGVVLGTFNLGIFPTSGSGDIIVPSLGGGITVTNTVGGSIAIQVTTATRLNVLGGTPIPNSAGGALRLEARTSAGVLAGMVGATDYGGGFFYATEDTFTNNTTTSASANITVSSIAVYSPPLNYTFRAFGNKWIQIA